jgi:hypothetical protein
MPRWDTASADRDGRTRARQARPPPAAPAPALPACCYRSLVPRSMGTPIIKITS